MIYKVIYFKSNEATETHIYNSSDMKKINEHIDFCMQNEDFVFYEKYKGINEKNELGEIILKWILEQK